MKKELEISLYNDSITIIGKKEDMLYLINNCIEDSTIKDVNSKEKMWLHISGTEKELYNTIRRILEQVEFNVEISSI